MAIAIDKVMCKTVRSLGLTKEKEHAIEDYYMNQLRSSGPEYVVKRIKELREWFTEVKLLKNSSYQPPAYHRHTKGKIPKPKGVESILFREETERFFDLTGAIMKSISLSALSKAQRDKWVAGTQCENVSDISESNVTPLSRAQCAKLARTVKFNEENRPFFDINDIHGTAIPLRNGEVFNVKIRDNRPVPEHLYIAWLSSMENAPALAWTHILDNAENGILPKGVTDSNREDFISFLRIQVEKSSEWALGEQFNPDEHLGKQTLGLQDPVGCISLLQQAGGKLRTVANPNRLVQWTTEPFGKAISALSNQLPGVFVTNQVKGMQLAQELLKSGDEVYSFDLSSATDTLDYKSFIKVFFRNMDLKRYPWMETALDSFELYSSSSWRIPEEAQRALGIRSQTMTWKVGQPLGLRPSFPMLTLMNWSAGYTAQMEYYRAHPDEEVRQLFAVVGDDFVCSSKIARDYAEIISKYNGVTNFEKTMHSTEYAEFCSHLITKDKIIRMKPRWILNEERIVDNLNTFSRKGIKIRAPKVVYEMWRTLSAYRISGIGIMPRGNVNKRSLEERVVAHLATKSLTAEQDAELVSKSTLHQRAKLLGAAQIGVQQFLENCQILDEVQRLRVLQAPVEIGPYKVWDWKEADYKIPNGDSRALLRRQSKRVSSLEQLDKLTWGFRGKLYPDSVEEGYALIDVKRDCVNVTVAVGSNDTFTETFKISDIIGEETLPSWHNVFDYRYGNLLNLDRNDPNEDHAEDEDNGIRLSPMFI